ncbi:MAG: outer membrane lipoprotein carrier protein LolA [Bacteroidales bacterium]|nr:outer membrane lipoprotein carrier protein LolA [Bacteroidales bacterium]
MKTFLLSTLIFAFTLNVAFSQDNTKADEVLNALSTKLEALETMKFEFSYTMENAAEKINESKSGSIYIKGDKYRLYIADQLIICDGVTIWTILKESKEVQINNVDPKNQNTPNKMLTSYGKNYRAKFIKETPSQGFIMQTIDLTPNTTQSFYKIRLEINKSKNIVYSSTIYDKNGTTYTYLVSNFIENPKVFEHRFTFDKNEYADYEINDMR